MKLLVLLPILAIILAAGCIGQTAPPTGETGALQIKITDQAQELQSLNVVVDSVQVHLAAASSAGAGAPPPEKPVGEETGGELTDDTSNGGWITVLSQQQTIDLVSVKDLMEILSEAELHPGLYTQVRFKVSSATAVVDGQSIPLTVPSKVIRFVHPFRIEANKTSSLIVDFYADYSVEMLPAGRTFSPVAKIQTEFAPTPKEEAERIWNEQSAEARQIREQRIAVAAEPGVAVLSAPSSAAAGEAFEVTWKVNSPVTKEIQHTAVHYGPVSVPGILPTSIAPPQTDYAFLTAVQSGTIPNTFRDSIATSTSGTLYYRAHAIVDGKNYWSAERSILVTATQPQGQLKEFMVELDDSGIYPPGPFQVGAGDTVRITFKVRTTNVRFGGLQVRSSVFDTGKILPGGEKAVEFIAQGDFSFSAYWPSSNNLKGTAMVDVQ